LTSRAELKPFNAFQVSGGTRDVVEDALATYLSGDCNITTIHLNFPVCNLSPSRTCTEIAIIFGVPRPHLWPGNKK